MSINVCKFSLAHHTMSTTHLTNTRHIHSCYALLSKQANNLKGKKHSSQLWLQRQIKDPYVEKARAANYRCRSAFKLLEINQKYNMFTPGLIVIDCGAAPGSWTQVATKLTNADGKIENTTKGLVFAIDRQPFHHIEGAQVLSSVDFTLPETQEKLRNMLNGKQADIVMSDMAPNATGIKEMDHENIITLAYSAIKFALGITRVDGTFLTKIWDGGRTSKLEEDLLKFYKHVKIVRPHATRSESSEMFFLARGFRGLKNNS